MAPAIEVRGLGKQYRLNARQERADTLRDVLAQQWRRWQRNRLDNKPAGPTEFWALDDVSFDVEAGEVLGVIGRNGAGKSTLLKILARITEPTRGEVDLHGRVGSLLEVGTGFHAELSGRENVYLNGAILGMRRREIQRRFDEIVDFAGVEQFIDTPVKHYSSGMYMRLAFAVAAHLETEILLVDEVLAVGDAEFQKKCLGKMGEVAQAGRTVLFVSHNMSAVRALTTRCLLLSRGRLVLVGKPPEVTSQYLAPPETDQQDVTEPLAGYHRSRVGEASVRFSRLWIDRYEGQMAEVDLGQDFTVLAEVVVPAPVRAAHWGITIKRVDGNQVLSQLSLDQGVRLTLSAGRHLLSCTISDLPVSPGDYLVDVGINESTTTTAWDVVLDYPLFRVVDRAGRIIHWADRSWGAVNWERISWKVVA